MARLEPRGAGASTHTAAHPDLIRKLSHEARKRDGSAVGGRFAPLAAMTAVVPVERAAFTMPPKFAPALTFWQP